MGNNILELTDTQLFTLFNNLLVRERSVMRSFNEEVSTLLNYLWDKVSDKTKDEVLWHEYFRHQLHLWDVPYGEDLERLNIPENLKEE